MYDGYKAILMLEDGSIFKGIGFGYPSTVVGEVVFNTGMVGYTEALTDPSYKGQMLCLTYPLVGNYGIPSYDVKDDYNLPRFFESDSIKASALIIHELSPYASHYLANYTLDEWLYNERIPGIYGIDTRELTKRLRVKGVMMGILAISSRHDKDIDIDELRRVLSDTERYDDINFVEQVSTMNAIEYRVDNSIKESSKGNVVLIDTGTKYSIIRNILRTGYNVVRLPYNVSISKVLSYNPKGVLLSNGPGDPKHCKDTIDLAKELLDMDIPVLGICLGNQILALAAGADTYKLQYGHRGQNKPCLNLIDKRCYITSQNHGYCVKPDSLQGTGFNIWFKNADDGTVEGIIHKDKPIIAVQFHPEAAPGPYDCQYIFDTFAELMEGG
jgi:carbamoyl-phosphate synthase small subunit